MTCLGRKVQSRIPIFIPDPLLHIDSNENLDQLPVSNGYCNVQCCLASFGFLVGISPVVQEEFYHGNVATLCCRQQIRRPSQHIPLVIVDFIMHSMISILTRCDMTR